MRRYGRTALLSQNSSPMGQLGYNVCTSLYRFGRLPADPQTSHSSCGGVKVYEASMLHAGESQTLRSRGIVLRAYAHFYDQYFFARVLFRKQQQLNTLSLRPLAYQELKTISRTSILSKFSLSLIHI